jgi:hypothetical protein
LSQFKEKADALGVPLIPVKDNWGKKPVPYDNPIIAVCGKCGIELRQIMHFACGHSDCPAGLGPVPLKAYGDLVMQYQTKDTAEMYDAMDVFTSEGWDGIK